MMPFYCKKEKMLWLFLILQKTNRLLVEVGKFLLEFKKLLVLFLKFLLLSTMSFYYAYVLQLAGTCSNWCQTLLMKGA